MSPYFYSFVYTALLRTKEGSRLLIQDWGLIRRLFHVYTDRQCRHK